MKKAFELYEQLRQRMGVVIVGPSKLLVALSSSIFDILFHLTGGSGKSSLWRLLRHAMIKIGQQVNIYTMNPKAMPRNQVCHPSLAGRRSIMRGFFQLLGHIDIDTREWSDGVLTYSARMVVKETQGNVTMMLKYVLSQSNSVQTCNLGSSAMEISIQNGSNR